MLQTSLNTCYSHKLSPKSNAAGLRVYSTPCSTPLALRKSTHASIPRSQGASLRTPVCLTGKHQNATSRAPVRVAASAGGGSEDELPLMAAPETKVQFLNTTRHQLVGTFTDAKSDKLAILCHGYAGSKDGFVYPKMAKALAAKKISSLRFDFTGNGESDGAFEFGNYLQEVADLRCAVQYVRESLRKTPIALVGHSKGANVVLLYAAQFDDVPLVINIAARFDMKRGIKERFGEEVLAKVQKLGQVPMTVRNDSGQTVKWLLTKKALEERMSIDMEAAAKRISLSEVLTVHGKADATIPYQDAEAFSRTIRQHMLWPLDGADHFFSQQAHADQMIRKVSEYISQMA
uniref:Serine aminopeptidase S33 domain-containing protein n=1 Tax=Dunaliella tertiolecta TaxID=3047 RepID=A0A7S3QKD6_DUNTE|mmetsp:Transcript_5969/g.15871  ORF Transcript_5969/g.15871 Transcript_5969/m.15871 type:complete len:347 (+) Transcript_5969:25-1065(+)